MLVTSIFSFSKNVFKKLVPQGHQKPFPKQAMVLQVCITSLLKTLWEKEKLLVQSNFFSHSVFYPFGNFSAIFIKFKIVSCNLFQSGRV